MSMDDIDSFVFVRMDYWFPYARYTLRNWDTNNL